MKAIYSENNEESSIDEIYNAGDTANETVASYGEAEDEYFLYGSNMAWKNVDWSDETMGTILCSDPTEYESEGPNANSLRPALYDRFVAQYGIEHRISTFEHYAKKGAKVNTIFLSGPRKEYSDRPCPLTEEEEKLSYDLPASFKNLYKPIWITKDDKRVVNPNNYYAQYVHDVVCKFNSYTRFWEIWNEPDLTYKGNGDKKTGEDGNWWDSDPNPCELHNLRSPIQHYVRLLRISYEVIKSIDPKAIVCTGGLGYASFLDAILRNTDNPDDGKKTDQYPKKGGAYFDCVSFHVYPMYYLREWTGRNQAHPDGFTYFRHTDAALEAALNHKGKMEDVLIKHKYNGDIYPKKEWILSETNIPSKRVVGTDDNGKKWFIGSDEAQRNYLTKIAIACQKNDIDAIYVYCPYDNDKKGLEGEYDVMGFYNDLPALPGPKLILKPAGKAWRTMVELMAERKYCEEETGRLNLNNSIWIGNIDGGAFYSSKTNDYIYVLWAKTSRDMDETASVKYTFPSSDIQSIVYTNWDGSKASVEGREIMLTGSPVFIKTSTGPYIEVSSISLDKTDVALEPGKNEMLTATIKPDNATNKGIIWKSSDASIVSVDNAGKITAYKAGSAEITVYSGDSKSISAVCVVTVSGEDIDIPVSGITTKPIEMQLMVDQSSKFDLTITPKDATNKDVKWFSSDSNVVTVDSNGNVKGLKVGVAWINAASVENKSISIARKVTVIENDGSLVVPVTKIELNKSMAVYNGDSNVLVATVIPENATNKNVRWFSSNDKVVAVDPNGKIKALAVGIAWINAESVENKSILATCKVTVSEKPFIQ